MTIKRPTLEQLQEIVSDLGMNMSAERVGEFLEAMEPNFQAYHLIESLPDEIPEVKYPRTPGYRPAPEDNPHNAWYVKTDIKGAATG